MSNMMAAHGEWRAANNWSAVAQVVVVETMTAVAAVTMAATMMKGAAYKHDYHLRRSWFVSHSKPWYNLKKKKKKKKKKK